MADDSSEIVKEQSEVVAATDMGVKGNGPAFFTNMLYANSVASQNRWDTLAQSIVAKAAESIMSTDPQEGGANLATLMEMFKSITSPNTMYPPMTGGNDVGTK